MGKHFWDRIKCRFLWRIQSSPSERVLPKSREKVERREALLETQTLAVLGHWAPARTLGIKSESFMLNVPALPWGKHSWWFIFCLDITRNHDLITSLFVGGKLYFNHSALLYSLRTFCSKKENVLLVKVYYVLFWLYLFRGFWDALEALVWFN